MQIDPRRHHEFNWTCERGKMNGKKQYRHVLRSNLILRMRDKLLALWLSLGVAAWTGRFFWLILISIKLQFENLVKVYFMIINFMANCLNNNLIEQNFWLYIFYSRITSKREDQAQKQQK